MKAQDIRDAYVRIRKIDQTIPDEVLDFMRTAALEKLEKLKPVPKVVRGGKPPPDLTGKFVVRLFDGFDNVWMDVSPPVTQDEATRIFHEKTDNGTKNREYADIDYYAIFPADTKMMLR